MKKFAIILGAVAIAASALVFHAAAQSVQPATANTPAPAAAPAGEAKVSPEDIAGAQKFFNGTCAGCHGDNGAGGDRGPSLMDSPHLRTLDVDGITQIIRGGQRTMPPFPTLPAATVAQLARWIHSMNESALESSSPQQLASGEAYFFGEGGCGGCHMVRGRGASNAPDLSSIGARSTRVEMAKWLDNPTSMVGIKTLVSCPGWAYCPDLQWSMQDVVLKNGGKLNGFVRNQTEHEVILQTQDGKLHLLDGKDVLSVTRRTQSSMPVFHGSEAQRADLLAYLSSLGGINSGPVQADVPPIAQADIDKVMNPKSVEWTTYYGSFSGNRYSALHQINTRNVKQLQPQWAFTPGGLGLEGSPIVLDGVMYVTGGPTVCALNARTGLRIWCVPRTNGLGVPPAGKSPGGRGMAQTGPVGPNRGVAILGDRLYYTSDDAYMVCLNRLTGAVMWAEPLAEPGAAGRPYTSAAPLVVGDLVITGLAGGDGPLRGFIVAYHANTGKEAWRFYTIPKPGEPLSETWVGRALITGGGATWVTGSYDRETDTLYWAVGNPYPDTNPDERGGINLYTNSVVALDVHTGKLKWHYQFTPYDTHDWDATEPFVLADTMWKGKPRKLLMTAQRSGVFYVLDRTNGEFLLAKPFVKKETWTNGFDPKTGFPVMVPGQVPTVEGTKTCPGVRGATNWYSTAFNPATKLFYVMAAEDCGIYRKTGRIFGNNPDMSDLGTRSVRALNIETGDVAWDKKLTGPQETNYTGVLSTGGGLVFHGETGGDFAAVDAATGKTLYTFRSNDSWRAVPMTYMVDGRQYVAGMDGQVLWSFALGYK